jgi:hypothetical protein
MLWVANDTTGESLFWLRDVCRSGHGLRPPEGSFRPTPMPISVAPSREVSDEPPNRYAVEQDAYQVCVSCNTSGEEVYLIVGSPSKLIT